MDCILIDTSHLMYRSHHTFRGLENANHQPTGIFFGVMRAIEHLAKTVPDAFLVFTLDGKCDKRKRLYPGYKEGRGAVESYADIIHEFGVKMDLCELIRAAGCAVVSHVEYEADDIIAMLALKPELYLKRIPISRVIYSGDDDFCQLVDTHIRVLKPPASKTIPERWMNVAQVYKEWGIAPSSLALYRSFVGDTGDRIPGLPRIPRAQLQEAVEGKQTPSDFYDGDGLAYFNPTWKHRLSEFREQCETNYKLTRLPWDFPPSLAIEYDEYNGCDIGKLSTLFEKLEFSSFQKKIGFLQELLTPISYGQAISSVSYRSES